MFEWIRKHKFKIIIIVFILLIGVPFITHCLFKINAKHSFWVSTWSAGDFLSFYGSVLSFAATVILSFLALWQNEIIRDESNKHTKLLEEMEKSKSCPFFYIYHCGHGVFHSHIKIGIQNISDNIAIDLELTEMNKSLKRKDELFKTYNILKPQGTWEVDLENGFLEEKNIIEMSIDCKDIYGNKIMFNITGKCNIEQQIYFFNVCKQEE